MANKNLLNETIQTLEELSLTLDDIKYIVLGDKRLSLEVFKQNANHLYDAGYGFVYVPMDLYIVGDNWWLEREEYDGSEWWAYKEKPLCPEEFTNECILIKEFGD